MKNVPLLCSILKIIWRKQRVSVKPDPDQSVQDQWPPVIPPTLTSDPGVHLKPGMTVL